MPVPLSSSIQTFTQGWLGQFASDPTLDGYGNPVVSGAQYYNNALNIIRIYDGSAWGNYNPGVASQAGNSANLASQYATSAANSATSASASAGAAAISAASVAGIVTSAQNAATSAQASSTAAASSATSAVTSANNAAASDVDAQTQATNAATSATNAAASATAAATSATLAGTNSASAASSAASAAASATSANTSATNAATNASSAFTSASNAATSESNASASAASATASATTATTQAGIATTQATSATNSASSASTSATNAAASATSATNSAISATGSASTATTQATNASNSATAAASSATSASGSATSASTSATTATTQAGIATTQATNASNSATAAAASAALAAATIGGILTVPLTNSNVLLTGAQFANAIFVFTGTITANIIVTVPATSHVFIAENNTTGAFTVTINMTGGSASVVVPQSKANSLFCDGTSGVYATSSVAGLQFSGTIQVTVSGTGLTSTNAGTRTVLATSSMTTTLPAGSTLQSGAAVYLDNQSAGSQTIQVNGSDPIDIGSPFTMNPSDKFLMSWDGSQWRTALYSNYLSPVFKNSLTVASGTITITNSQTSGNSLTINSTSNTSSGAQIQLVGNGGTTPSKYIRSFGGALQVVNNAGTTAILTLSDAGNLVATGGIDNTIIGANTPLAASFTTLSASSTVSGTGFSAYLASPPAIGGTVAAAGTFTALNSTSGTLNGSIGATTANTGAFTTLSASSTISGTGFTNYFSSPPPLGNTAANTGAFTTLTATIATSGNAATFTSSGSTNTIKIVDTGVNGANIAFTGNGATTPNKFIRVNGGVFQMINSAYSASILNISDSGTITAFGNYTGDFSNATLTSRIYLQTTTPNSATTVGALPLGSATTAGYASYNNSTPTNSASLITQTTASAAVINSAINGSGTLLPMTFQMSGTEAGRLSIGGKWLFNTTTDDGTSIVQINGQLHLIQAGAGGGIEFGDGTIQTTANGTTAPISTVYTPATGSTSITTSGYVPGFIQVYQNGARLVIGRDYTATDSVHINLTAASGSINGVADTFEVLTAVTYSPQTIGTSSEVVYTPASGTSTFSVTSYTVGFIDVYLNGSKLVPVTDFTATTGNSITLVGFTANGTDQFDVKAVTTYTPANALPQSGGTMTGNITFSDGSIQGSAQMGRNRIINGGCLIQQRSAATGLGASVNTYGTVDRFKIQTGSGFTGAFTLGATTFTVNSISTPAVYAQATTATSTYTTTIYASLQQTIEGYNCYDLVGQSLAVQFWFNATVAGTYSFSISDSNSTHTYTTSFVYTTGNTPQSIQIIVPTVPTAFVATANNGAGMQVWIGALNQATYMCPTASLGTWQTTNYISAQGATVWTSTINNQIAVTNFQIEAGSICTPFERENISLTLHKCQRYYQLGIGSVGSGGGGSPTSTQTYLGAFNSFPVPMRVAPTYAYASSISPFSANQIGYNNAGTGASTTIASGGFNTATNYWFIDANMTNATTNWWRWTWTATAEL